MRAILFTVWIMLSLHAALTQSPAESAVRSVIFAVVLCILYLIGRAIRSLFSRIGRRI